MSAFKLSARYAKSLIDLSVEQNQLEQVTNDMRVFVQVCKQSKDFTAMLRNPVIHLDAKQKIIQAIFGSHFSKISMSFVNLIVSKTREAFLPDMAAAFLEQYNAMKGITSVTLTTAVAADDEIISNVKKLLQERAGVSNIEFHTKINADLIGGYQLQYKDKMYDASIKRKLNTLNEEFKDNQYLRKI